MLTRIRGEGEVPETYEFTERSVFGVLQGRVKVVEKWPHTEWAHHGC